MGRRRAVISYQGTARLAVAGGTLAVVAVIATWALPTGDALASLIGVTGSVSWLAGTASGVLALSTPYRRTAGFGLALCGYAAVSLVALDYAEKSGVPRDQAMVVVVGTLVFAFLVVPTYFMMDRWFRRRGDDEWGGPPG